VSIFLTLTALDFALYFLVDSVWIIIGWWFVMVPVKAFVCPWNHHHQHLPMFHSKALNRVLEMAFTFHTGATPNAWTLHHVHGHHMNYLDQDKDESRWRRSSGETFGLIRYTLVTALTTYPRAYNVGRRLPRLQRAFVGYGILTLVLVGALVAYKPMHGPWRNLLTGNLGYHTAHHYRQGLHWSKLPELHAKIADKIPAEFIKV